MVTHAASGDAETGGTLPDAIPCSVPHASRLSWDLGSRIVDDAATLVGEWRHDVRSWRLSVYRVAPDATVFRVCTPVGREKFYDAGRLDPSGIVDGLRTASGWERTD